MIRVPLLLSLLLLAAPVRAEDAIRRYALVASANDGGEGRARLRYADTDAVAFGRVLQELGGVAATDQVRVESADRARVLAGFAALREHVARTSRGAQRSEVVVYYSGHSDERGLLLRGELLAYEELRALLADLPVDVRIAVLDSCSSGALTRAKGGATRPAFLTDVSSRVRGYAYLASSSVDEVAQESDAIRASFFTHFLVTGLRGAADRTGDGRVTLTEAYEFAFHETLARTERTVGGPQHAAYDIQLAGSGDLVLTDLRGSGSRLRVGGPLEGRVTVRDAQGALVGELRKYAGRAVELALDAGPYAVTVERADGSMGAADVRLPREGYTELREDDLVQVRLERVAARKGAGAETLPLTFLNVSLLPPLDTQQVVGRRARNRVALGVLAARTWGLDGVGLSAGANWSEGAVRGGQVAGLANVSRGDLLGLQASAGANVAFADARGVQASTFVNSTDGAFKGLQLSGTINRVGATMRGGQVSSGINVSQDLYGTQLGLLNIAEDVSGLQLGLVNVGRVVTGVQLGLLNISDEATAPIGLLNVVRRGRLHFELWADDVAPANVGVRYGGRWVHALVQTGAAPFRGAFRTQTLIGLGLAIPVARPFALDVDLSFGSWQRKIAGGAPENGIGRLRVVGAWSLQRRLAVMAGVSLNSYNEPDADVGEDDADLSFMPQKSVGGGKNAVQLWPGVMFGVRI